MSEALPDPLIAQEVDMRDEPLPLALFIEIAMTDLGLSLEEAERLVRECADQIGAMVENIGHG